RRSRTFALQVGPHLYVLKLRRSVAVAAAVAVAIAMAAPIEPVVDPHLQGLDISVRHKESVSGEALEPTRSNKCPVIQPQETILQLCRPIGRESPLDARAHEEAAVAVVGGGDCCAGCQICDREVLVSDPSASGLVIQQPGDIRHGEPSSHGRDPSIVGSHLDSSSPRNEYGTGVVVIRGPIELGLNSQNSVADLPVVPELASPDEYAV